MCNQVVGGRRGKGSWDSLRCAWRPNYKDDKLNENLTKDKLREFLSNQSNAGEVKFLPHSFRRFQFNTICENSLTIDPRKSKNPYCSEPNINWSFQIFKMFHVMNITFLKFTNKSQFLIWKFFSLSDAINVFTLRWRCYRYFMFIFHISLVEIYFR